MGRAFIGHVGRMAGPQPGSWVSLGSLHIAFFVGRGQEAGLALGFLYFFLSGLLWVGWVGRGQEAGLPSYLAGSDGVGCGQRAGFVGVLGQPRPGSWAPVKLPSYCLLSLGPGSDGWAAAKRLGSKGSLHISGPGWDGWAAAKMLGLHWAPFILFRLLGAWVGTWEPFMFLCWGVGSDFKGARLKA